MPVLKKTTKPLTTTWCKRPGTVQTLHFDTQRLGKRVNFLRWLDTGEVVVSCIWGDGRTMGFRRYDELVVRGDLFDYEALAMTLAAKHFDTEVL